jgi:Flp pilus assembly protein TadB
MTMVGIMALLLPIFLSAVLVFLASFLFHMVLPFHRSDFAPVPDVDAAQDAIRKLNLAPGDYMIPCAGSPEEMKKPEFKERLKKGPVLMMTVFGPAATGMGASLAQWFVYLLFVGVLAAYITGRALGPGAPYLVVFRFAGATSFIAYSVALLQNSIWYKQKWSTTIKNTIDGLVYGCLTAGVFGWLWPK